MNQQEKLYRVGLFGHYGNKNLGDEAIILAAIQNLRERITGVELKGFSINPEDTFKRYDIEAFPIRYKSNHSESIPVNKDSKTGRSQSLGLSYRVKKILAGKFRNSPAIAGFLYLLRNMGFEIRFLFKVRKELKKLDVVVICGSNQFVDNFGGPWGFPYTLMKWGILAKSAGAKIFFVSVGAGPLTHPLSYWMLKKILNRADYLSYRDNGSKKLIEDQIPNLKGFVYPDLAHSLKTIPDGKNFQKKQRTISINPMPVFDSRYWYISRPDKYEAYVDHLAKFVKYLVNREFAVNLFNNHPSDLLVMDDLLLRLQKIPDVDTNKINMIRNETIQNLINTLSEADIVVATRFHATVLPLRLGKPVLGICYYRKSKELLEDVGLGEYYVDINEFNWMELCKKFDSLVANFDITKFNLNSYYKRHKELMDEQWNRIANLIMN